MNVYGRFSAAVGSVALNAVLALLMIQEAGAAVPDTDGFSQGGHSYTVTVGTDPTPSGERCVSRMRARAILAIVLGLIV